MGRMTENAIKALFNYGKEVYQKHISLDDAAEKVHDESPEVAFSSAKHYIKWYGEMRNGDFLTWNSNSDLLIYYAEHIIKENGLEAGKMACQSVLKFADHVNRTELTEAVHKLVDQYHLNSDERIDGDHIISQKREKNISPSVGLQYIKSFIAKKGFSYKDNLIENFYLCLKAKPFVILAGTSGTGKTRLVRLFAEGAGATRANGRYQQVAVRPDWSDSSDLFGHVDLNGHFISGAVTDFIEKAAEDLTHPYFLCLDEMNLARVEYYLSDFLSVVETREMRDGHIVTDPIRLEGHKDLSLPENLYVVGTVNMDETTFPFSRKVLDRANAIEFSFVDLMPPDGKEDSEVVDLLPFDNRFFRGEYLTLQQCLEDEDEEQIRNWCLLLCQCNDILKKANAQVGYRVRDEIIFYLLYSQKYSLMEKREAMDWEILQKILPRIQGSSSAVRDLLGELFQFCAGDYEGLRTDSGEINRKMSKLLKEAGEKVRFPRSAAKLASMMRRYEEDGFTSYWQ